MEFDMTLATSNYKDCNMSRRFKISNASSASVTRQIALIIPANLHRKVATKCQKEEITLSSVVRDYLKKWSKK